MNTAARLIHKAANLFIGIKIPGFFVKIIIIGNAGFVMLKKLVYLLSMSAANADIIRQLQRDILPLQGFKPPTPGKAVEFQLGPLEMAFPNARFPTGAVHEFVSRTLQQ